MKKLLAAKKWLGLLCLSSLFFVPQIFAQGWLPKCSDILKLEPKEFVLLYVQKNTYRSDIRPESEIVAIWTKCQQTANDTKLKNNPQLKARIISLKTFETTFFDAQFTFAFIDGGYSSITGQAGSLIQEKQDFFEPYLERHLGQIIGLALSKSGAITSNSLKARHAKAKASLEAEVKQKSLGADKNVDAETIKNLPLELKNNYVQNWENSALQYRGSFSDIYTLVGQPVDVTSTTILEFLAKGYY
jgi:hypothetical protein